jgi:hypothetical protein
VSGLSAEDRELLAAALDGRCSECLRPPATDEDWANTEPGERPDLCWDAPRWCGFTPEVSADDLRAAVVEQIVARHAAAAVAAFKAEAQLTLDRKATEWCEAYAESDSDADYGRWDAWQNAARIVRNLSAEVTR